MTKNKLIKRGKETVGLGVLSMGGMGAMGAMQNIPGMPAQAAGVTKTAGAGLGILNVGQMMKNVGSITEMMEPKRKKRR